MKSVLIFLIGVLVGANIVYFVMTRDGEKTATVASPPQRPLVTKPPTTEPAAPPVAGTRPPPGPPAIPPSTPQAAASVATVAPAEVVLAPTGLAMPLPGLQPGQLTDTF